MVILDACLHTLGLLVGVFRRQNFSFCAGALADLGTHLPSFIFLHKQTHRHTKIEMHVHMLDTPGEGGRRERERWREGWREGGQMLAQAGGQRLAHTVAGQRRLAQAGAITAWCKPVAAFVYEV